MKHEIQSLTKCFLLHFTTPHFSHNPDDLVKLFFPLYRSAALMSLSSTIQEPHRVGVWLLCPLKGKISLEPEGAEDSLVAAFRYLFSFVTRYSFNRLTGVRPAVSFFSRYGLMSPSANFFPKAKLSTLRGLPPLLSVTRVCILTLVVSIIYEKKAIDHRRVFGLLQYFPVLNRESIWSVPVFVKSYNLKIAGFCWSSCVTPSMGVRVVNITILTAPLLLVTVVED